MSSCLYLFVLGYIVFLRSFIVAVLKDFNYPQKMDSLGSNITHFPIPEHPLWTQNERSIFSLYDAETINSVAI